MVSAEEVFPAASVIVARTTYRPSVSCGSRLRYEHVGPSLRAGDETASGVPLGSPSAIQATLSEVDGSHSAVPATAAEGSTIVLGTPSGAPIVSGVGAVVSTTIVGGAADGSNPSTNTV